MKGRCATHGQEQGDWPASACAKGMWLDMGDSCSLQHGIVTVFPTSGSAFVVVLSPVASRGGEQVWGGLEGPKETPMSQHHHIFGAMHVICMTPQCLRDGDPEPCEGDDCSWYGEGGYEAWKARLL